jgi:quinol monooxygenase YgiN
MNKQNVRLRVDLAIHEGKFAAFEAIANKMTEGTQKEPGALAYDWYLSPDKTQCRLVERYADQNALAAHIDGPVVQELVPKLLEHATLASFEVYGDPGSKTKEMLSAVGARIYNAWQGISR